MKNPFVNLSIILAILLVTLVISVYEHNKVAKYYNSSDNKELMVEQIPSFQFADLRQDVMHDQNTVYSYDNDVVVIHFWGTWCAPCIPEFPDLVEYARKLESEKRVKILVVAVNDQVNAVEKFLKRFGELPENMILAIDPTGKGMEQFGTVKVPETFVYYKGRSAKRYIGPQDWVNSIYIQQIKNLL